MGFNTTVVILNDALSWIENDEGFGRRLAAKVRNICGARKPQWVRAGTAGNAALVVETHHADEIVSVAVGENSGEVIRDDDGNPVLNHFCHACGRPHEGYEEKYCPICGKVAQERKTLYDAIHIIEGILRGVDNEKAGQARDIAIEAAVVAPHGERLNVLDWKAIHNGDLTVEQAYEKLEAKKSR